jgi:tetratricopeptide (TPR) repeat protein
MMPRMLALTTLMLASVASLSAQAPEGDRLWEAGSFEPARQAYERELATNPRSVHSLYRLGVLASWRGDLDSALALAATARSIEPNDPDVRLLQAQVLSWQGKLPAALAHYDSIIADNPDRLDAQVARARVLAWASRFDEADSADASILQRDPGNPQALAGRAEARAWRGDLKGAEAMYRSVLTTDSSNAAARLGLATVHFWQGHSALARRELDPLLAAEPNNRDAQTLDRAIRLARHSFVELAAGWNNDSDHNTSWWQSALVTVPMTDNLAVFGSVGLQESHDPVRSADRQMAEAGFRLGLGKLGVTAAAGARRLQPEGGDSRTSASYRGALTYKATPRAAFGAGFSHHAFDETAQLIESGLVMDAAAANVDPGHTRSTTLTLGGGGAWFSDDNQRYHVLAALMQQLPQHFFAGLYGRQMGYDFKGTGYFSPDRFRTGEVRGGWVHDDLEWTARLAGGLGAQQAFRGAETQAEWHADASLGRKWGAGNLVEVFGGVSNSLERTVTGAYRYRSAGLRITLGL